MDYYNNIPAGNKVPEEVNVLVEIPKGSQNKYEFDKKTNVLKMQRVLFSPFHYPGDYGFIPQTHAKDNDPLDALVLISHPTYPGTLIECRPIGVLKMIDSGEQDDKILCVPKFDIRFSDYHDISDVKKPILNEIMHFFKVYKQLEGKKVTIGGWKNAREARKIILESVKAYRKK